jgi:hypothetical protein
MHPALHSWRDDLSGTLVRMLAYLGAAALLSMAGAHLFQTSPVLETLTSAPRDPWITIGKPFPAFTLSIPEAADAASHYAIRRNVAGGGRQDILSLGEPNGADPYLEVQIYRPGSEISQFATADTVIDNGAEALGPTNRRSQAPLMTKFGPMAVIAFDSSRGTPRHCFGFVRQYDDPRLQISGRFCRGGALVDRSTLACALDRLTLLSAGSFPKVGALFAHAELNRQFCVQHEPILTPTPKYQMLWKALPNRPMPRRIGR